MEKKKHGIGIPPKPLTKTNALESSIITKDLEALRSSCSFAASSTESIQVVVEDQSKDSEASKGQISRSILTNPAWYRDDEGRTGFKPKYWYYNLRQQQPLQDSSYPDRLPNKYVRIQAIDDDNYESRRTTEPNCGCSLTTDCAAKAKTNAGIDFRSRRNIHSSSNQQNRPSGLLKCSRTCKNYKTSIKHCSSSNNSHSSSRRNKKSCNWDSDSHNDASVPGSQLRLCSNKKLGVVSDIKQICYEQTSTSDLRSVGAVTTSATLPSESLQQISAATTVETSDSSNGIIIKQLSPGESDDQAESCRLNCKKVVNPFSLYCLRRKQSSVCFGTALNPRKCDYCKALGCTSNPSLTDSIIIEKESSNDDYHVAGEDSVDERTSIDQSMFWSSSSSDPPYGADNNRLTFNDVTTRNNIVRHRCSVVFYDPDTGIANKNTSIDDGDDDDEFQRYIKLQNLNCAVIPENFFPKKLYENLPNEFSAYLHNNFEWYNAKLLPALPRSASGYFEQNYTENSTSSMTSTLKTENDSLISGYLENLQDLMQTSYYENVSAVYYSSRQDVKHLTRNTKQAVVTENDPLVEAKHYTRYFDTKFSASLATSAATTASAAATATTTESAIALTSAPTTVTASTTVQPIASVASHRATPTMPFNDKSSQQLSSAIFGTDPSYNWKDVGDLEDYLLELKLGNESIASSNESLMSITSSAAEALTRRNFNY
uniref:Non-specific serine/threonine protein kinase n=1 Tax=Syphacia muris TaxID=451379 RepID=A0A0N5ANC7_9BILA